EAFTIILYLIVLFLIFLFTAFPLVASHSIYINFNTLKIKHEYELGIFKLREKWQDLKELEYISVYKVNNYHRINLWYKRNQIVNLIMIEDYSDAIKKAFMISDKLKIDLLDASVKGNHKWIDKEIYKKTSKIVYI